MNQDSLYIIREGPREYPIYRPAIWIRRADTQCFHKVQTVDQMPQELIVHDQAIRPATAEEVAKWRKANLNGLNRNLPRK